MGAAAYHRLHLAPPPILLSRHLLPSSHPCKLAYKKQHDA
jgi:hypothetical protein